MTKYILGILSIFFLACQETEIIPEVPQSAGASNKYMYSDEFNAAGIAHNESLQYLLENLPSTTNVDNFQENTLAVISDQYTKEQLAQLYWFQDYGSPVSMLEEMSTNGLINNQLYQLAVEVFDALDQFEEGDSMDAFIEERLASVPRLSPEDHEKYMNFLSVLKHSYHFWDPNGLNGASFFGNSGGRVQFYDWIKRLIAIAEADAVTTMIDLGGGGEMPYTTFDYVQSGYFHFWGM